MKANVGILDSSVECWIGVVIGRSGGNAGRKIMKKGLVLLFCFSLSTSVLWAFPVKYEFEHIDFLGAYETYANDINNNNVVVGVYADLVGACYGFVYHYDGDPSVDDFESVTIRKDDGTPYFYTNFYGNNDTGLVAGWYRDRGSSIQTTMVYDINARTPVLEVDTSFDTFFLFHDVNNDNWVVGNRNTDTFTTGIIKSLSEDLEYTLDLSPQNADIYLRAINNNGLIIGQLREEDGTSYGITIDLYSYLHSGNWNVENYRDVVGVDAYEFVDVNDNGVVLGWYRGDNSTNIPFLLDVNTGEVFNILANQPDLFSDNVQYAYVSGLNNDGYIVGWDYEKTAPYIYENRGFLLSPVYQNNESSPVVPEPATLIGFLIGLAGLVGVKIKT